MKPFIRDKCPACGVQFGWRGAAFNIPPKASRSRKPEYYCAKCRVKLERVVPMVERIATTAGFMALFVASIVTLWQRATLPEIVGRDWLVACYLISIIGISISIVMGITHQHYCIAHTDKEIESAYSDGQHDDIH